MKSRGRVPSAFRLCALFVFVLVLFASPAYAYGDPNAIGLASQILTPLLIMLSAAATFLRKQIGAAFSALFKRLRRSANA